MRCPWDSVFHDSLVIWIPGIDSNKRRVETGDHDYNVINIIYGCTYVMLLILLPFGRQLRTLWMRNIARLQCNKILVHTFCHSCGIGLYITSMVLGLGCLRTL